MNGAFGDGEAQAGAAGSAFASISDTVEGNEDIGELLDGYSTAVVAHANDGLAGRAVSRSEKADFHIGAFFGVADGVADDVFDGAAEDFAISGDGARFRSDDADEAVAAAGFEVGVGDDVAQERFEIYGALFHQSFATFQASETEQAADEAVQAFGFEFDAIESRNGLGIGVATGEAQGDSQARQRGAQFVGDIADQAALRGHEGFDLFGHVVEIAAEVGDFVFALGGGAIHAGAEIAGGEAVGSRAQLADGRSDVTSEPKTDQAGHEGDNESANDLNGERSAQETGDRGNFFAGDEDVAGAVRAGSALGHEFSAVGNQEPGVIGLQRGLGNDVGFGGCGLGKDFVAFVVEQESLPVQGGIEGFEVIGQSAHAVVFEHVRSAGGDERGENFVELLGAVGGEFGLGGDDGKNESAADENHGQPEPQENFEV